MGFARNGNERPTLKEFTSFLDRQARALGNTSTADVAPKQKGHNARKRDFNRNDNQRDNKRFKPNPSNSNHAKVKTEELTCSMCTEEHATRKCPKFLKLNLTNRKDKARAANLCFNCLTSGHTVKECKSGKCNRCEQKHNSLLCPQNPNNRNVNATKVASRKNKEPKGNSKRNNKKTKSQ